VEVPYGWKISNCRNYYKIIGPKPFWMKLNLYFNNSFNSAFSKKGIPYNWWIVLMKAPAF